MSSIRRRLLRQFQTHSLEAIPGLVVSVVLLGMVACSTTHGITRVGNSDQEVVVEALSVSDGQRQGTRGEYAYFASRDGGLSWRPRLGTAEVQWSEGPVDTPVGTYRIEGPDIVFTRPDGQSETVYSTAHWNTSSNRWYQAERTRRLNDRVLATRPTSITYDPNSGNLIAGLGIQGVIVGVPNGQWMPVAVEQYSPIYFSRELKLKELLKQSAFWITVFVFPVSMISLAFFFRDLLRKSEANIPLEAPNQPTVGIGVLIPFILFLGITIFVLSVSIYVTLGLAAALVVFVLPTVIATNFLFRMAFRPRDQKRGCLVMFFSVPCTALAILITASFLVDFGRADAGTGPLSVILHVPFAFVSVIAAISGSTIAWRGQWKIRWQVILASYATMGAFVAILFLGWVQSDVSVLWPQLASFILCLAAVIVIYRSFRIAPSSSQESEAPTVAG